VRAFVQRLLCGVHLFAVHLHVNSLSLSINLFSSTLYWIKQRVFRRNGVSTVNRPRLLTVSVSGVSGEIRARNDLPPDGLLAPVVTAIDARPCNTSTCSSIRFAVVRLQKVKTLVLRRVLNVLAVALQVQVEDVEVLVNTARHLPSLRIKVRSLATCLHLP
jgi:hypothetical protein